MRRITACAFDLYGTLLDLDTAIAPHRAALGAAADGVLALWRAKQLEYTWLRTMMGRHTDFAQVTRDALAYTLEAHGLLASGLGEPLLASFRRLGAHPDARPALEAMRASGLRVAVLSNGSPDMIAEALEASGLAPLVDVQVSVEGMGRYKPAPSTYAMLTPALGGVASEILMVSANAWDAAGAANAGFEAAWVNRRGAPAERLPSAPAIVVRSLAELRGALDRPDRSVAGS